MMMMMMMMMIMMVANIWQSETEGSIPLER
jgi:hypothetical protein